MFVVSVTVNVVPEMRDDFVAASVRNADASRKEPGCLRFDVLRTLDDPSRFLLYEVYRAEVDQVAHQKTSHYLEWKETVASMMASPRTAVKCASVSPEPWV